MYRQVLTFIADRGQARVTEIQQAFGLSTDMAACLCIELQDARWLTDTVPSACHHLGVDSDCAACPRSSGPDHASPGEAIAFEGCCGINSPYRVTDRGLAYLGRR